MKRLGIVGAGGQGFQRAESVVASGRAVLVGVASRSLTSARRLAERFGAERVTTSYTDMADWDLDALMVMTPNDTHYEITKWALQQGLDVLVAGPVCIEMEHAEELDALVKEKGLVVEVGFSSVYHPLFEEAREVVAGGGIGKPVAAYATAFWRAPRDSWYYRQDVSGGMPLTHISYNFNRMRFAMGRPVTLMARASQAAQVGEAWVQEETCAVVFTFDSGALGSLVASYVEEDGLPDRGIVVVGTEGSLQVTFTRLAISRRERVRTVEPGPEGMNSFHLQFQAFLECVEKRREGRNPISDAIVDIRVANAIAESNRTGRVVSLA